MLGQESDLDNLSEDAKMKGEEAIWSIYHSLQAGFVKMMAKQVINVFFVATGLKAVDYFYGVMRQTDEKHDFFKVAALHRRPYMT